MEELANLFDLVALSTLCETLSTHPSALDILALYISIPSLLKTSLRLVDNLDWSSIGKFVTTLEFEAKYNQTILRHP
jgi:hypothetical protein